MAVGDVYAFVATGTVLGELLVNVFHYKAFGAGDVDLDALSSAFFTDVLTPIAALLDNHAQYTQLEIKQVVGGSSYNVDVFASPLVGAQAGQCLPPAVCFTYRMQRTQLHRRHGYKRFSGVNEGLVQDGVVISPGAAVITNVAAALAADLTPISGIALRPVILHSQLNGQPVIPPVPQDIQTVVYSHLGTQNTRKFKHGR